MKVPQSFSRWAAILLSSSAVVHSFPTAESFAKLLQRDAITPEEFHSSVLQLREKTLALNPSKSPIDVHGKHEFRPPNLAAGDQRGPCPGLNALANHGYISRDGVVGILEVLDATHSVFGMGIDIATILAVMGTVGVGNPLSLSPGFSIGGVSRKSSNLLGSLGGLLGTPRGLGGSHNWIESDASGTRNDLYVTGDATTMNMTLFLEAYNAVEGDVITLDDLAARAAKRFDDSVATNPYFWHGPYTGMVARLGGYFFGWRLLSNHTAEHPDGGWMTKEVFKSFWGVTEEDGQLVYKFGHERIPENWYRIPGEYGLVSLNLDIVDWVLKYPRLASIGGNLGKVNTYAAVNLEDITGGVLNAANLLQGNNLICFVLQVVKTFAPNSLSTLFKVLAVPLQLLNNAVLDPLLDLGCPAFKDLTMDGTDLMSSLMEKFPGAKKAGFAL